jgi:hypothetical protein
LTQPRRKRFALVSIDGVRVFIPVFQYHYDGSRSKWSIRQHFQNTLAAAKVTSNELLDRVLIHVNAPMVGQRAASGVAKQAIAM